MQLHLQPLILALALVAMPLLAGVVVGRMFSRLGWWWLPIVVGVVGLSLVAVELLPRVGAWDLVCDGGLLIAGLFMGVARVDRRDALLVVVSSAIAFAGLEWAVRCWLPPAAEFPPAEDASFIQRPGAWDAGCAVLYGPAGVDGELRDLRHGSNRVQSKTGPLVVHLGDSMTFGEGVREVEAFPALLDARQPDVVHANDGVWAVGTDFEYLLLQKILAEQQPAMVVLHVYVGNDIFDIDRPYECCEAGPLLDYPPRGPTARCRTARWRFTLASRLGRSPAPYPLRVATMWSHAARYAAAAFSRLGFQLDRPPHFLSTEGEGSEEGWDHFGQLLTSMRDELRGRGVDFIVDLLPNRGALESTDPTESPSYRTGRRIATVTAQLGIQTVDAWDVFAEAVRQDGAPKYFLGEHDIHFTPEGHRLLADWLERHLPPVPRPEAP